MARRRKAALVGEIMMLVALLFIALAAVGVAISYRANVMAEEAIVVRDLQAVIGTIISVNQSNVVTRTTIPIESPQARLGLVLYLNLTTDKLIVYDEKNLIDLDTANSLLWTYLKDLAASGYNISSHVDCTGTHVRQEVRRVAECFLVIDLAGAGINVTSPGGDAPGYLVFASNTSHIVVEKAPPGGALVFRGGGG